MDQRRQNTRRQNEFSFRRMNSYRRGIHFLNYQQFRNLGRDFLVNRWRISDEQINAWRRLDRVCPKELGADCVINTGAFLGIVDRPTAAAVARQLNVEQRGMSVSQFNPLMYEQILRNERIITHHELRYFEFSEEIFHELRSVIGPGHATILELRGEDPNRPLYGGHAVILAVAADGELIILDPQQEHHHRGQDVYDYIRKEGFYGFGLYLRHRRSARPREETELQLRKPRDIGEPKSKWRRLNDSPEFFPHSSSRSVSPAPSRSPSPEQPAARERSPAHSKTRKTAKKGKRKTVRLVPVVPSPEEGEITEEPAFAEGSPAYQPTMEISPLTYAASDSPIYDPTAEPERPPTPPRVPTPPPTRRSTRNKKGGKHRRSHKK